MQRTLSVFVIVATLGAWGCGFQHSTNVQKTGVQNPLAPSAPPPTSGGGSPGGSSSSLIGMWVSNEVSLPGANSCGHFQYQIASQTSTSISGTLSLTCANLTITADAAGQMNGSVVTITLNGTGSLPGLPNCPFSLTGDATLEDKGYTLRIPYSGTTCLGPVHGTEVLHRPAPAQPNPPPPPPPPPSAPPPSQVPGGFDLNAVQIVGGSPDVRGWPVTSQITSLVFSPGTIHIDHTKRGQWPGVDIGGALQEATIWIFENINGQWYGTGGERLRPGQTDKQLSQPSRIGFDWFYSPFWAPFTGYVPRPGEVVGFMVVAGSTRADANAPVQERTGVILIGFPPDGVTTSFPPYLWRE
jgi:hypothetical protein